MKTTYQSYDKKNMFGIIFTFAEQLEEALRIGKALNLKQSYTTVQNIVFTGMGGSAIAGDIVSLLCAPTARIPFVTSRTYTLPSWVNKNTLVICMSYSGNTEETLSSFADAQAKGAQILGITSGGNLAAQLQQFGYDTIVIPGGLPPRTSLGYLSVPLLFFMHQLNVLSPSFIEELEQAIASLKKERALWSQEANTLNTAWTTAQQIYKSYPLIYGEAGRTSILARRLRGQLAENSKMLSGYNELPELDHNEIVGFRKNSEFLKQLGIVWLVDEEVAPQMTKRFKATWKILDPLVSYQITISAQGTSFIERMIFLIHLIDWISFWCAILHQEDPTPVDRINALKQLLAE